MKTVRLSEQLENQLKTYAEIEGKTESEIIREALVAYMAEKKTNTTPYEAGKSLFGLAGSGQSDRSATYKTEIKKKIRAKKASH